MKLLWCAAAVLVMTAVRPVILLGQGALVVDSVFSRGLEAGSQEADILEGIRLLRSRLDSLRITYSDTTFIGGHIDRVRERFTHQMFPIVGRWFDSTLGEKRGR